MQPLSSTPALTPPQSALGLLPSGCTIQLPWHTRAAACCLLYNLPQHDAELQDCLLVPVLQVSVCACAGDHRSSRRVLRCTRASTRASGSSWIMGRRQCLLASCMK